MDETWGWIAHERRQLADLLESLGAIELSTPSLCEGWTVRDVFAHLALSLDFRPLPTLGAGLRAGFRVDRAIQRLTADMTQRDTTQLVQLFRDRADRRWNPPGFGPGAPLTDLLVHGVDLRRPIGRTHQPEPEALLASLDFVTALKASLAFTKRRTRKGLRLAAADVAWEHGDGPEVRGPGLSLLTAMCGRPAVLDDLEGDGVATLHARLA